MREEHRFVAEIYRFLAPFINTKKPVFLSLDGVAAQVGVAQGIFLDPDVPDMWFTLGDSRHPTLIEAKVTYGGDTRVKLGRTQLSSWQTAGHGRHKPTIWIATNTTFTRFYFWTHCSFLRTLDEPRPLRRYHELSMPSTATSFRSIQSLALHILKIA